MAKRSKRIVCFSLCVLVLCMNFISAKAEALPDVMSGSSTLADCIMSYYSMVGCAVADNEWISTLYNSFGETFGTVEELAQQGYLVLNDAGNWEPVQELVENIEASPAYSSLQLNEMFNVSAEEVATGGGLVAASGGSILAGSLGGVATTGTLPLLGAVTAAYWGGIGIGTLAAHALGLYSKPVEKGMPITDGQILNKIPSGSNLATYRDGTSTYIMYSDENLWFLYTPSDSTVHTIVYSSSVNNGTVHYKSGYYRNNTIPTSQKSTSVQKHYGSTSDFTYKSSAKWNPMYRSNLSLTDYLTGLRNGTIERPDNYSPDLIGENGNQKGQESNNGYTIPDIKPMIDTQTQAGKPLTMEDWLNFANGVKNNNSGVDPFGNNAGLYEAIMKLIVDGYGGSEPDPDPDPWSPPVVTPVPDPSYPDPVPDQQITENPQESENPQQTEPLDPTDTGKPWRLPDLREKFPFCIPWDIAKVFSKLKVNVRQAPHISWRFNPPNTPIDYTFNLDLEDFEPVATLLRTLELMGFIVGLAFVTRYLIGAN